jgi:hypothetical protein
MGRYEERFITWSTPSHLLNARQPVPPMRMVTGVRTYPANSSVALLTQRFPDGLTPRSPRSSSTDEVASAFPTIARTEQDFGLLYYEGVQLQNTQFFPWHKGDSFTTANRRRTSSRRGKTNIDGGGMPLVMVAADGLTLVASPLDDFFTAVQTDSEATTNFSFGMQASVVSVAPGHTHATLLYATNNLQAACIGRFYLLSFAPSHPSRSRKIQNVQQQFR